MPQKHKNGRNVVDCTTGSSTPSQLCQDSDGDILYSKGRGAHVRYELRRQDTQRLVLVPSPVGLLVWVTGFLWSNVSMGLFTVYVATIFWYSR